MPVGLRVQNGMATVETPARADSQIIGRFWEMELRNEEMPLPARQVSSWDTLEGPRTGWKALPGTVARLNGRHGIDCTAKINTTTQEHSS
jgi:hypothetical protein